MDPARLSRIGSTLVTAALAAPDVSAQAFEEADLLLVGGSPANNSTTENVDFGDVDLDGDWDVAMADGGDDSNDQNRLWLNQGGLQAGTIGTFLDATDPRFPTLSDDSRDVEFVDFDGDGDLDLYTSNTAQISNQGNRWWTNDGGAQGGTLGYYTDETGSRWVGLNAPPSSIAPTLLLPNAAEPETFIDWSCDCDFGDLDNDGDMDLVHSTYGGVFSGTVPTRLFLNDGDGFYSEFNPSGFQLTGTSIASGQPGLWCEGIHTPDTTLTDGSQCDVASPVEDIDLGDTDGDLDLDLVQTALDNLPRFFANRLEENGGSLGFRDRTSAVYPAGHATTLGNFEHELGDLDNDGDLDLLGINWPATSFSYDDSVLENDGAGVFTNPFLLPGSGSDDNEGDFLDYDNDGDLDALIANFSGQNRLYRNDTLELGRGLSFRNVSDSQLPVVVGRTTLDVECADVDADGDYDFLEGNDGFQANRFFENVTGVPDTTAARLERLEVVPGHVAGAGVDPVRVQVYDNAPWYVLAHNTTRLEVSVEGAALPDVDMVSSGGQIFRGELPGNLVGEVEYRALSADEYGNTGASDVASYENTGPAPVLQGAWTPGPLGQPTLLALTAPLAGAPLHLAARNATPGSPGFFLFALTETPGGLPLGDGAVLNVGLPLVVLPIAGIADAAGDMVLSVPQVGAAAAGNTVHAQVLFLDGAGGNLWSSTQSLALAFP